LGLDPLKKTFMFVSGAFYAKYGWYPEYDKEILLALLDTVAKRTDAQVIVRLHPWDDGEYQHLLISQRKDVSAAVTRGERNDLMWASDFVITVNSSLALDALILRKIVFKLTDSRSVAPGIDLGRAVIPFNLQNLPALLTRALDAPKDLAAEAENARPFEVERHANTVDGHASRRIAQLVLELAKTSPHTGQT